MNEESNDKKFAALSKLREMRNSGAAKPARPGADMDSDASGGGKAEALRKFLANRKNGAGAGGAAGGGAFRDMIKARGGMGAAAANGGGGLRDRLAGGGENNGKRALLTKIIENRKAGGNGGASATLDEKTSTLSLAEQRAALRERIAKLQAKLDQLDIDGSDDDLV